MSDFDSDDEPSLDLSNELDSIMNSGPVAPPSWPNRTPPQLGDSIKAEADLAKDHFNNHCANPPAPPPAPSHPESLRIAIEKCLKLGSAEHMKTHIAGVLAHFRAEARTHSSTLNTWRGSMPSKVRDVAGAFELTAFGAMLEAIGHPDTTLIHDLRHGFHLRGHIKSAQMFSGKPPLETQRIHENPIPGHSYSIRGMPQFVASPSCWQGGSTNPRVRVG